LAVLAVAVPALGDEHAAARFRGTGAADPIRVTNVRRGVGREAGHTTITFDIAWDHSWRAGWEAEEKQHGGTGPLRLESWDAAWVLVKYQRPGADGYSHAMLSAQAGDHRVPAGAALDVGRTDDGGRGLGVFVYRAAPGHGPTVFKDVTLRWENAAEAPADADIRVFALQMVYVPQCRFWAGDGTTNAVAAQLSAGNGTRPFPIESEAELPLGGEGDDGIGSRNGSGLRPGNEDDFSADVPLRLPAKFPKGYRAFYCMRNEITQQQYCDFLNSLPYARQCERSRTQVDGPPGTQGIKPSHPMTVGRNDTTISVSGSAATAEAVVVPRTTFVASRTVIRPARPATYKTSSPFVACNFISCPDGSAYAAWAGLRPMTELEFEKACRGPLQPVAGEFAWGTAQAVGTGDGGGAYVLHDQGGPDERVVWEGADGLDALRGNVANGAIRVDGKMQVAGPLRVGIFATPQSDRGAAGASYWGILDLSGNVTERAISVGLPAGRNFAGTHGDDAPAAWKTAGFGIRGGGYPHGGVTASEKSAGRFTERFRVSDRYYGAVTSNDSRAVAQGFRCVRTAP